MTDAQSRKRPIVEAGTVPVIPRYIKLRHDAGRGRWVILAPERVFNPDETAVAVLKLCDGVRSVKDIASQLSKEYNAPESEIIGDIISMLQDLSDKGVITA
jgi:pyrroloquinoline quinone biosynthesis protein D